MTREVFPMWSLEGHGCLLERVRKKQLRRKLPADAGRGSQLLPGLVQIFAFI